MTATASDSEIGDNNGRQADYYIGPSGIPRLVGAVERQRTRRKTMNNQWGPSGGNSVVGTDPVKLNKCLYNLTVRNRNGSNRTESDTAETIRSPSSHKSKSPTSGSDNGNSSNNNNNNNSIWRGPMCSASSTVITTGLCNSRRNSVTSSRGSSSIPRSTSAHWTHLGGRNATDKSGTAVTRLNGVSSDGRSPPPHATTMLLSDRQRSNATATGVDSNRRINRGECGNSGSLMRQCRFTVAVRRPPPPTTPAASTDNRLSYQRQYDRSIFGCNRLDQIVLPPLQI